MRGQRRQRGPHPGGADDGHEHDVGLRQLGQFDQSAESAVELRAFREGRRVGAGFRKRSVFEDADVADAELARDFREPPVVGARSDADELQPVAMGGHNAQGVFADGAGGAEEHNALPGGGGWRGLAGLRHGIQGKAPGAAAGGTQPSRPAR